MGQSDGRSCPVFRHSCTQFYHPSARQTLNEHLDELKPLLKTLCLSEGRLSHEPAVPCFPGSSLVMRSPLPPCWCHNPMPILFGMRAFPWSSPAWQCSPSVSYFFKSNLFCILTSKIPLAYPYPKIKSTTDKNMNGWIGVNLSFASFVPLTCLSHMNSRKERGYSGRLWHIWQPA